MLSHVPLFSHPQPETVLVIGGGDGGIIATQGESIFLHKDCVVNLAKITRDLFTRQAYACLILPRSYWRPFREGMCREPEMPPDNFLPV
jgi:spermidine synthase